jgi:hypothetical protein
MWTIPIFSSRSTRNSCCYSEFFLSIYLWSVYFLAAGHILFSSFRMLTFYSKLDTYT